MKFKIKLPYTCAFDRGHQLGASLNYNAAYLLSFLPSFPAGWLRFKDKCFMFKGKKDDVKANWSHARSWCKDQGGELAVIDDQYENGELSREKKLFMSPVWQKYFKYLNPPLLQTLCPVT